KETICFTSRGIFTRRPVSSIIESAIPDAGSCACTMPLQTSRTIRPSTARAAALRRSAGRVLASDARQFNFVSMCWSRNKKAPREKGGYLPLPFLAKSTGVFGVGGCPDLRHFADYSGGTVADFHGLPLFPNLLNVGGSLCCGAGCVNRRRTVRRENDVSSD